jgi:hypothetical protein
MTRKIRSASAKVAETPSEFSREDIASAAETQPEVTAENLTQAAEEAGAEVMASVAEPESVGTEEGPSPSVFPAIGEYVSKAVYGAFYYVSYGVVFGSLIVAHFIPMDNAMGRGIKDGAVNAENAFRKSAEAAGASETLVADTGIMSA